MRAASKDSFWMWGVGLAVLLVGTGIGVYVYQRDRVPEVEPAATTTASAPPEVPAPRPIETAPPQPERAIPLPPLDESDAEVQGGLTELLGSNAVKQFLVPQRIVRNVVVTIDNLPREKAALQQRPIKPAPGKFVTSNGGDATVIARENYARYAPFVAVVKTLDAKTLVGLYRGWQPLFQQSFEELGHPNSSFNTRLLEVIDHLLATPDVPQPVRLVQPSVYYKFADPSLESLSAGQKLLIRMGSDNAGAVKAKLREIKAELR
ncbi:MAG TPA: DUF3014 domain-containing protein [Gammaproteobacteria bacterium]|nr:DUF3014 domain-containing protein [Gammaproteobacteria bacterium]